MDALSRIGHCLGWGDTDDRTANTMTAVFDGARADDSRPWLTSYAEGVRPEIDPVEQTLPEALKASAQRFPNHVALEFFGRTTKYKELYEQVDRAALGLRKLGVRAGDRVALVLPNCPQHVIAFYAVLQLGAVVVEHNPLYTERELCDQFEDHEAAVAIVWDVVSEKIDRLPAEVRPGRIVTVNMTKAMPALQQLALRLPIPKAQAAQKAHGSARLEADASLGVAVREASAEACARTKPTGSLAVLQYTERYDGEAERGDPHARQPACERDAGSRVAARSA